MNGILSPYVLLDSDSAAKPNCFKKTEDTVWFNLRNLTKPEVTAVQVTALAPQYVKSCMAHQNSNARRTGLKYKIMCMCACILTLESFFLSKREAVA